MRCRHAFGRIGHPPARRFYSRPAGVSTRSSGALVGARTTAAFTEAGVARRLDTTSSASARLEGGRASASFAAWRRHAQVSGWPSACCRSMAEPAPPGVGSGRSGDAPARMRAVRPDAVGILFPLRPAPPPRSAWRPRLGGARGARSRRVPALSNVLCYGILWGLRASHARKSQLGFQRHSGATRRTGTIVRNAGCSDAASVPR